MSKPIRLFILLLILSPFLMACGSAVSGDQPSAGEIFGDVPPVYVEKGCIACHAVEPAGDEALGPAMPGLVTRSAEIIGRPDYSGEADTVEAYLRESILNPAIYLVDGYEPLMPPTYGPILTEQELAELIDYLLTFE